MPDDELKQAYRVAKATDSDDALLDAAKEVYADELATLEKLPEKLLERLIHKKEVKTPSTTPTQAAEQIEDNIRSTSPNAVNTVMRPEFNSVEKDSKVFDNIRYDFSLDKFKVKKKLNNSETVAFVGDFFDKSLGVNYSQAKGTSFWRTGFEYEPKDNAAKLTSRYQLKNQTYRASIYLDNNDYGISAAMQRKLGLNSSISVKFSTFKSDSAFRVEYKTQKKEDTVITGIYGSTKYKEVGVLFRLTTF